MRPRINKNFGNMTFNDFNNILIDYHWTGHTVSILNDRIIEYTIIYLYAKNKEVKVQVSRLSKLIIKAYNKDKEFQSINELIQYIKK